MARSRRCVRPTPPAGRIRRMAPAPRWSRRSPPTGARKRSKGCGWRWRTRALPASVDAQSVEGVRVALADTDRAVRLRAAQLLANLDPAGDHGLTIRPALGTPAAAYEDPTLAAPATSPNDFIDTEKGTI